ncbi:MAG: hypothetical protein ACM3SU_05670 [Acidobacteriota bacterium]
MSTSPIVEAAKGTDTADTMPYSAHFVSSLESSKSIQPHPFAGRT